MPHSNTREFIPCPYCGVKENSHWADDNGFTAVRCNGCQLVYVNPRPNMALVDAAVQMGTHSADANSKNVVTRRVPGKISHYRNLLSGVFADRWSQGDPISWLDVGAGFGEIIEAVKSLAPEGSQVIGLEPMRPKAEAARARGLDVREKYLHEIDLRFDILSVINVFSHIPDFHSFLLDARKALNSGGEIFIETGDTADLARSQVPGEIDLPDHLVFAAERHITGFLERTGFEVVSVSKLRIDTMKECIKDVVKRVIGRPVAVRLPYTSPYRTMLIRAKVIA